jgi:hypothetical protein
MKAYRINRAGAPREMGAVTVDVETLEGRYRLEPTHSQVIRNYSPDGFEFGYTGAGPSQLALAILLDFTDNITVALRWHQEFKWDFLARLEHPGGLVRGRDIDGWLKAKEAD